MVNAGSLKVNPDEFIANMLAHGALTEDQLALMQSQSGSPPHPAGKGAVSAASSGALWPSEPQNQAVPAPPSAGDSLSMQALPGVLGAANSGTRSQQLPSPFGQPPPPLGQTSGQAAVKPLPKSFLPPMSVAELEAQGAALLASGSSSSSEAVAGSSTSSSSSSTGAARLSSRYPFAFSSLEQMTVGEVGQLLVAYKELVLKYECLAAALEWHQANPAGKAAAATAGSGAGPANAAALKAAAASRTSTQSQAPPPPAAAAAVAAQQAQQQRDRSAMPAAAAQAAPAGQTAAFGPAGGDSTQAAAGVPAAEAPAMQQFGAWPDDWESSAAANPSAPGSTSEAGTTGRAEANDAAAPSAVVKEVANRTVAEAAAGGGAAPVDELLQSLLGGHDDKAAAAAPGAGGGGGAKRGGNSPSGPAAAGSSGAAATGGEPAVVDLIGLIGEGVPAAAEGAKSGAADSDATGAFLFEGMDVQRGDMGTAAPHAASVAPPSLLD